MTSDLLHVALGERSYPIHLESSLPDARVASLARGLVSAQGASRALVVTDDTVRSLYAAGVADALGSAGLKTSVVSVPPGEGSKTLTNVSELVDHALASGLNRRDVVVALGGGVVGDVAGFVASMLHRGVSWIQVPTTLLAQVDSSVGGKTGVNHAVGKNLVGAFWQPTAVVSSTEVLHTLPERQLRCGLAEAVKHGFIADESLVEQCVSSAERLLAYDDACLLKLVRACCEIKAQVVSRDERESKGAAESAEGVFAGREVLNFGHTLGHAYEFLMGYGTLTHGEAVSLGMVLAARLSESLSIAAPGLAKEVASALHALGLPVDTQADELPDGFSLIDAARTDKKATVNGVRFVLLSRIGSACVKALSWEDLEAVFLDGNTARK